MSAEMESILRHAVVWKNFKTTIAPALVTLVFADNNASDNERG